MNHTSNELVRAIFPNVDNPLSYHFANWLESNDRFHEFAETYVDKLRRKFRDAKTFEDECDVWAELDTARRLTANLEYRVQYEPYGEKGCDFYIETPGGRFNAETKRVRETVVVSQYYDCREKIVAAVREIPSQLGISLECFSLDTGPEHFRSVCLQIDSIVAQCVAKVVECKAQLSDGKSRTYRLNGVRELNLRVQHLPEKSPDTPTANLGGSNPIPYTQKEDFKFTDLLIGHLGQFNVDAPNVLVVECQSATHEASDLLKATWEIQNQVSNCNELFFQRKKFKNIDDFIELFRRLSATVFITDRNTLPSFQTRNTVWENPMASKRLEASILEYFRTM